MLVGRLAERAAVSRALMTVRRGRSAVLVVRGEPGIGKTALVDAAVAEAAGMRVLQIAGVESEAELPFAAVQQLCAPIMGRVSRLAGPQRSALAVAFGLSAGEPPDQFLVGMAALSLLADAAQDGPLLCVVDDVQWLDQGSAQALAFAARRLLAEPVALVFVSRQDSSYLRGLPELIVGGLPDEDARALLAMVLAGPLDERVRDRIIAETRGNPLALLALPRRLTLAGLAGGFGEPDLPRLSGWTHESFQRRYEALPDVSRRLLLLAAAEPTGDPGLLWRAAAHLGIEAGAADEAQYDGLLDIGVRVAFYHPLVRTVVYQTAPARQRRAAHRALAEATDAAVDPDRRAWHLAHATLGPDDAVAAELEVSADRAQARGGLAAAAAFLDKSAALTADPARRSARSLAAARATALVGGFDAALRLVAAAEFGPLDDRQRALASLLRGQVALLAQRGRDAPPLLIEAARQCASDDPSMARDTYLEALSAALFAGRLAVGGVSGVAIAARAAPPAARPARPADLLLDGLVGVLTGDSSSGLPQLRQALDTLLAGDASVAEGQRWLWIACHAAILAWDHEAWQTLAARQLGLARDTGALAALPVALNSLSAAISWTGDFEASAELITEADAIVQALGGSLPPYAALPLAAWQGREAEARRLAEASHDGAVARGEGMGLASIEWATALLCNGLGRYADALSAAQRASEHPEELWSTFILPELAEAAARSGQRHVAAEAADQLSRIASDAGTEWALAAGACARALAAEGAAAEGLYREAVERFGRTRLRPALARTQLLYGEWLRRQRRRGEAREQLRSAYDMLAQMRMGGFAERARRELEATGEHARRRNAGTVHDLTPQERQIARLAARGATNADIASQLFISAHTVAYHLTKVFAKLGVSSRGQLAEALARLRGSAEPARSLRLEAADDASAPARGRHCAHNSVSGRFELPGKMTMPPFPKLSETDLRMGSDGIY
jgi:DNA-binding CsgD family transcriptional regulator